MDNIKNVVTYDEAARKHRPTQPNEKLDLSLIPISTDSDNTITKGTDGGLYSKVVAQLPDDQILSGDPTGTVIIGLTPSTQPNGDVNYTIKGDTKVSTSPNNTISLKSDGIYSKSNAAITTTKPKETNDTSIPTMIVHGSSYGTSGAAPTNMDLVTPVSKWVQPGGNPANALTQLTPTKFRYEVTGGGSFLAECPPPQGMPTFEGKTFSGFKVVISQAITNAGSIAFTGGGLQLPFPQNSTTAEYAFDNFVFNTDGSQIFRFGGTQVVSGNTYIVEFVPLSTSKPVPSILGTPEGYISITLEDGKKVRVPYYDEI
jgi:hypothetical protein